MLIWLPSPLKGYECVSDRDSIYVISKEEAYLGMICVALFDWDKYIDLLLFPRLSHREQLTDHMEPLNSWKRSCKENRAASKTT